MDMCMRKWIIFIVLYLCQIHLCKCGYPPIGDEVQAGSILLPASRRGRYLANIARRQAVDGTGVHFNKEADRMNADAKKKVDVLSEELLPYIIAEQERRVTLYKRVMTAIQNGEKGVTIAEIRNKPPVIIRKGLLYRCPTNRPPKEPDGSGIIMCEDGIEPTPIMYDSCLSAEDKELFIADNKYFFCNRHKIEGPDLPRNGSNVIACSPTERTSLNYTSLKCALEDTADVVVHYRYYPDRTYKFVTELDPDREMCDHWSPCQIGYIYSLPSQDTATTANELWRDYEEKFEDVEKDEIVPPIPEDSLVEFVTTHENYITSRRKILVPDGYFYNGTGKYLTEDGEKLKRYCVVPKDNINITKCFPDNVEARHSYFGPYVKVALKFSPYRPDDTGSYYLRFEPALRTRNKAIHFVKFLTLSTAMTRFHSVNLELMPGQHGNSTLISYSCNKCIVRGVTLRSEDGSIRNLDHSQYSVKKYSDEKGKEQSFVEIEIKEAKPRDFGDYFIVVQNEDGAEERIKCLTVTAPERDTGNVIQVKPLRSSAAPGEHFDKTLVYACDSCELADILCNGDSVLGTGRITVIVGSKMVNYNFPSFEDGYSCVYMGLFKQDGVDYQKILAIIDNSSPLVTLANVPEVPTPALGEQFQQELSFTCHAECVVENVHVNGIHLQAMPTRRNFETSIAVYSVSENIITIMIPYFDPIYSGAFQVTFVVGDENVTKTLMEIGITQEGPDHVDSCAKNATIDDTKPGHVNGDKTEKPIEANTEMAATSFEGAEKHTIDEAVTEEQSTEAKASK